MQDIFFSTWKVKGVPVFLPNIRLPKDNLIFCSTFFRERTITLINCFQKRSQRIIRDIKSRVSVSQWNYRAKTFIRWRRRRTTNVRIRDMCEIPWNCPLICSDFFDHDKRKMTKHFLLLLLECDWLYNGLQRIIRTSNENGSEEITNTILIYFLVVFPCRMASAVA